MGPGRLQWPRGIYAHFVQRLRDRGGEPSGRGPAAGLGQDYDVRAVCGSAAGAGWNDGGGGEEVGAAAAGGFPADDEGGSGGGEGRGPGVYEGTGGCGDQADS